MKYLKCHVNAQSVKVLIDFIAIMFLIWHTFYWDANPGKTIFPVFVQKTI